MLSLISEDLKVSYFLTCFVLFWWVSKEPTSRLGTFPPQLRVRWSNLKKKKSRKSAHKSTLSFVLVIRFSNYVIGQSSVYNSNVDAWSEVVGTRMKNPAWLNQMHPVGEFHICRFHIFKEFRNSETVSIRANLPRSCSRPKTDTSKRSTIWWR